MHDRPTILVIDDVWGRPDDPMITESYGALPINWLKETAATDTGFSARKALATVRQCRPDVVLLDICFGPVGEHLGLDILQALRSEFPVLPVLIFTSLDSMDNRETVVRCMELGANEYVEKAPSQKRMQSLIALYADPTADAALYGNSNAMRNLRAEIARVAFSGESSVLITGESGTGKELVARALHRQGPRSRGALVAKNCAGMNEQSFDVELFGSERSVSAGLGEARRGLIEEADGGILFLDEIADMSLKQQGKLLRCLETKSFRRVGGTKDIQCRFQLICTTNTDPDILILDGKLRSDFYYRVSSIIVNVPPLRQRLSDIPIITDRFIKNFKSRGWSSYPGRSVTPTVISALQSYRWPGNIRELKNVIERLLIMSRNLHIDVDSLPLFLRSEPDNHEKQGSTVPFSALAESPASWSADRLKAELLIALEVRCKVEAYKGASWKSEFMRLLYPEYKAANSKGFNDLVKRWTTGPWGDPSWENNLEVADLIRRITT